jgi:hypothetical protein
MLDHDLCHEMSVSDRQGVKLSIVVSIQISHRIPNPADRDLSDCMKPGRRWFKRFSRDCEPGRPRTIKRDLLKNDF